MGEDSSPSRGHRQAEIAHGHRGEGASVELAGGAVQAPAGERCLAIRPAVAASVQQAEVSRIGNMF